MSNWYFDPAAKRRAQEAERRVERKLAERSSKSKAYKPYADLGDRLKGGQPLQTVKEQGSRPKPMTPSDYRGSSPTLNERGNQLPKVAGRVRVYNPPAKPSDLVKAARPLVRHVGRSTFGMAARAAARLNPWLNAADIIAMAYRLWRERNRSDNPDKPVVNPYAGPILPASYEWCNGPISWQPKYPIGTPYFALGASILCRRELPYGPQSGQGPGQNPITTTYIAKWQDYWNAASQTYRRRAAIGAAIRVKPNASNYAPPAWHSQNWGADPNLDRYMPPSDQPFTPPEITQASEPVNPPDNSLEVSPQSKPLRKYQSHERSYRGRGERKFKTKSAKLAVELFKRLDQISEAAEIVDAFYDALPKDVQALWDAKAKERYGGYDKIPENFGQYGIGGLGHKLEALYYNWHKVDAEKAVYNIFKNQLSDSIIGGYQKHMPKNAGSAHKMGEIEFAKNLSDFIDYLAGVK